MRETKSEQRLTFALYVPFGVRSWMLDIWKECGLPSKASGGRVHLGRFAGGRDASAPTKEDTSE
jgi:hypothetical protein